MESSNERLQLLILSKDLAHMQRMKAMLHAHGIQAISEPTSLPWRSAGFEALIMVSTDDYKEATRLCLDREMAVAFTGSSALVSTEVEETLQHGVPRESFSTVL
jgi:hypothetical protein